MKKSSVKATLAMPHKVRCKLCQEWRNVSDLSNRQQNMLQKQLSSGRPIDPAHSGAVCREHSENKTLLFECSRCGVEKERREYSKASIKEDRWECKRCVGWIEIQEPKTTPIPEVNGHLSPEEQPPELSSQPMTDQELVPKEEEVKLRAPVSSPAALGLENTAETRSSLARFSNLSIATDRTSSAASITSRLEGPGSHSGRGSTSRIPERLRAKLSAGQGSALSSFSGVSTATTLREDTSSTTPSIRSYNAWDAWGTQHRMTQGQNRSKPETTKSTRGSLSEENSATELEDSQTSAASPPAQTSANGSRRTSGWHKPERLTAEELRKW